MFKLKKRGLRSIRSAIIIVGAIFLLPLVLTIVVSKYFSAEPIYAKYDEILEISKSGDNGYIYLKSADTISKRIYGNFINMPLIKYKPSDIKGRRYLFNYGDPRFTSPERVHFFFLQGIYKDYIKAGRLTEFLANAPLPNTDIAKAKPKSSDPSSEKETETYPQISRRDKRLWKSEFQKVSEEVLVNIKKANNSTYLIKYPFEQKQPYPVDISLSWEVITVATINCIISIESGEYEKALDWLESITELALRCYENSLSSDSLIDTLRVVYGNLLVSNRIPEWFYSETLCMLMKAKERVSSLPFSSKFELILLMLEDSFRNPGEDSRMNRVERVWTIFANYKVMSQLLEKNKHLFINASWDDIEASASNKIRGVIQVLKDIQSSVFYVYPEFIWMLSSGEAIERTLFCRNTTLSMIYSTMAYSLAKQHWSKTGAFPNSLQSIFNSVLPEEEIKWFESRSVAIFEPYRISIRIYPFDLSQAEMLLRQRSIRKILFTSLGDSGKFEIVIE